MGYVQRIAENVGQAYERDGLSRWYARNNVLTAEFDSGDPITVDLRTADNPRAAVGTFIDRVNSRLSGDSMTQPETNPVSQITNRDGQSMGVAFVLFVFGLAYLAYRWWM